MTKRAKVGGIVMISRNLYEVLEGPMLDPDCYRIRIRPKDGGDERIAEAPTWQGGKGPWKLAATEG